jgi:formylmethanofuran dehydrogenase subunit E
LGALGVVAGATCGKGEETAAGEGKKAAVARGSWWGAVRLLSEAGEAAGGRA